jgi:hypothetical protein
VHHPAKVEYPSRGTVGSNPTVSARGLFLELPGLVPRTRSKSLASEDSEAFFGVWPGTVKLTV